MTDLPATPAEQSAESDPTTALGHEVAERQRPLRARRTPMVGLARGARPGGLARRSLDFSLAAGLSLSSREQLEWLAPSLDITGLPVAPPAEWDDSLSDEPQIHTGHATLDHIIRTQRRFGPQSRPAPSRGLRSASARRGTRAGRDTGPGASARRLRSQTAPMVSNLDIQRLVSGDGADTRPRASRGGPAGAPSARSGPGYRPGQAARDRTGRPAPWLDPRGARSSAAAPIAGGALHGAPGAPGGPADSSVTPFVAAAGAPVAPAPFAGADDDSWLDVPLRAAQSGAVAAPATATSPDPAQVVAGLAAGLGADGGPSGLGLRRAHHGLPPSMRSPERSPSAAAAGAGAAADRLAARTAALVADAPVGGATVLAGPGAGSELGASPLAPAAAGGLAAGSTSGTASTARASASSGAAVASTAQQAFVASLRDRPPALALATPPRRSHATGAAVSSGADAGAAPGLAAFETTAGGGAPAGRGGAFDATSASPMPRAFGGGVEASPASTGGPRSTLDLPVGGPLVVTDLSGSSPAHVGATPSLAGAPARATAGRGGAEAARGHRGLGTVARMVSPAAPVAGASNAAPGVPSTPAGSPSTASGAGPSSSSPSAGEAVRLLRSLPDLAAAVTSPTMLAALGVSPEVLGTPAPPVVPGPAGSAASSPSRPTAEVPTPAAPTRHPLGAAPISSAPAGVAPTSGAAPVRPAPAPASGTSAAASAGGPAGSGVEAPRGVPTADLPVSPAASAPVDPGERFAATLERHGGPAPRPLPQRFEPIARAILPDPGRVRIAVDPASRAALAEAGKKAATAGDIVHLARPLDATQASIDILAHELTHVAHPSPLVRFFDDDRDSHEERLAREVGQVMAKAPVGTPPITPPPAPAPPPRPSAGAPAAAGGAGAPGAAPAPPPMAGPAVAGTGLRRSPRGSGAKSMGAPVAAGAPAGMLDPTPDVPGSTTAEGPATAAAAGIDIDRLLDALEARIIRELERRGRRWPRPM